MTATFSVPAHLEELSVDECWIARERLRLEIGRLSEERGRIDQELKDRFLAVRPDFTPESGGSVKLAGDTIVLTMTYARDYQYDERAIMALAQSEALTPAEYNQLVEFVAKVNGTFYNDLVKRGGALAESLLGLRKLKSARPEFKPENRRV